MMARILLLALLACIGCSQNEPMTDSNPTADELFQVELAQRGLQYTINKDGLYEIAIGDVNATVNLENVRRNYERDRDHETVTRFAQQLNDDFFGAIPSWADVQPFIRFSLEPSDYQSGFADTLHQIVNPELVKVFVYVPPDGSRISWITKSMVADWKVENETVVSLANKNMGLIASETQLESQEIDGVPLGMLNTQETHFKASLILTSKFRDLVSPTHGWPVYVVVPARDFVYVVPKEHGDFLGRLGSVVLREYNESGYPVSQEVFEVGSDGMKAIASFAPKGG